MGDAIQRLNGRFRENRFLTTILYFPVLRATPDVAVQNERLEKTIFKMKKKKMYFNVEIFLARTLHGTAHGNHEEKNNGKRRANKKIRNS